LLRTVAYLDTKQMQMLNAQQPDSRSKFSLAHGGQFLRQADRWIASLSRLPKSRH
jgi:hypothetical protein